MTSVFPIHLWPGLALLALAGALLYVPSLAAGKLRLQHQAASALAAEPAVFWPLLALVWLSRLALLAAVCGAFSRIG